MSISILRTVPLLVASLLLLLACGGGGDVPGAGDPNPNPNPNPSPVPTQPLIPIADMTGLRSFDGGATVLVLGFSSVMPTTEDRTVVHFDVRGLTGTIPSAYCHVPADNLDPGGAPGVFEVRRFHGDGVVSPDEWAAGTLTDQFTGVAWAEGVFSVSVRSWLQDCVDKGHPYFSLVLSGGNGTDRFNLAGPAGLDDPWIELQP